MNVNMNTNNLPCQGAFHFSPNFYVAASCLFCKPGGGFSLTLMKWFVKFSHFRLCANSLNSLMSTVSYTVV